MWCAKCQADVAAEASADNQRLHCASCGREVLGSFAQSRHESTTSTKDPRELLARWAGNQILDPFGPIISAPAPKGASPDTTLPDPVPAGPPRDSVLRFDAPHIAKPQPAADPGPATIRIVRLRTPRLRTREILRADAAHTVKAPHFERSTLPARASAAEGNLAKWLSLAGQMLAYLGILVLAIGTSLVLRGYLGGPPEYAPQGWFITTVGQILLFTGIVTLVSGGMEHATQEVTRQIQKLGRRILFSAPQPGGSVTGETERRLRAEIADLKRQLALRDKPTPAKAG